MKIDLRAQPSYTIAYVSLDYGESVLAERNSLAVASDGIEASYATGSGGVVKAALRRTLGGEYFFMGRYTAAVHGAWVGLAPRYPGDIIDIKLDNAGVLAEQGSLLACCGNVDVDVTYAGIRKIALREGATVLRVHGTGDALISTYGAVQRFDLADGEGIVVDTGHFVAMSDTCDLRVGLLGGVVASAASGEGLVARITGPGSVWIQTREERSIRNWLMPERKQNRLG
jgi:uncharacterized protein (TIGR00266 family)